MSGYRAERTHPDQQFEWQTLYPNGEAVTRLCTQGVAEVIAFALNAVAQGRMLAITDGTYDCEVCEADTVAESYDGPTDGVKPDQ